MSGCFKVAIMKRFNSPHFPFFALLRKNGCETDQLTLNLSLPFNVDFWRIYHRREKYKYPMRGSSSLLMAVVVIRVAEGAVMTQISSCGSQTSDTPTYSPAKRPTLDWRDSKGHRACPTTSSPSCSSVDIWVREDAGREENFMRTCTEL